MYISKRSGMNHTVLPANTPCLPFFCKRWPDGATLTEVGDIQLHLTTHLAIDPEGIKLSWPGWLTYSGRFARLWSPVSCRSRAGQGNFADQRPTFYRCATKPIAM